MVAGLAIAPEVMRHRVSSGGWHAALQPYPWLTAAALTLAALYALLAEGTVVATARNAFPAAERAQLALLIARGARRAGDGGRALDADRGGPRRSGRTGVGLHRKAPDRCQTRSGPEPGPGIAPGADPGKVAGGAPVPRAGATLDHG